MDGTSDKEYDNLLVGKHVFLVRATDDSDNTDPTPAELVWTILGPIADAGPNQSVKSNELIQLDGSNSSDHEGSALTYSWNQTEGPKVILNDDTSVNPMFTAPEAMTQTSITFQLTVTNEEGTTSKPDKVTITVSPISTSPPAEEPQTIKDNIKDLVKNPLDITNSIKLPKEITDTLTDRDRDNDQVACDLLADIKGMKQMNDIREIVNC